MRSIEGIIKDLPLYRAKKIGTDEYIIGYLLPKFGDKVFMSTSWSYDDTGYTPDFVEIDPTTLAIHMKGMVDIKGNLIFASLRNDGKGGDILIIDNTRYNTKKYLVKLCEVDGIFIIESIDDISGGILTIPYAENFRVIGKQE